MGNCSKVCRDNQNEVEILKGEYVRTKSGNLKTKKEINNSGNDTGSKIITSLFKLENLDNDYITESVPPPINEEPGENEDINNNDKIIKNVITFSLRNGGNFQEEINIKKLKKDLENKEEDIINKENKDKSEIMYLPNFDKSFFFPKKLLNAEKNFTKPINYLTDYQKYFQEDDDNIDLLILINTMNANKGTDKTKGEGVVLEYKGEKYLYKGEINSNKMPTGFGVLYTQDKKYEGNFFLGKLTGLGRYINEEGTCFEGIFDNNNIVSKATVITINKQNKRVEYFGDVLDFKKNGKGEEICKDEYKYVGDFSNDMKHGFGKLEFFESGEIYEGQFDKDEINGKGKYIWNNGEEYEGDFVKGIKHGKGIYKWPDGCKYEGDYNNGIRQGKGKYIWEDGRVFKGMFLDGKPNGKGKIYFKGKAIACEYKNGKPTSDLKKFFKVF